MGKDDKCSNTCLIVYLSLCQQNELLRGFKTCFHGQTSASYVSSQVIIILLKMCFSQSACTHTSVFQALTKNKYLYFEETGGSVHVN